MRILLVNGSPRRAKANSRIVLDGIQRRLGEAHEYRMVETMASRGAASEDLGADLIVVAFPLYIDSLHSTLLEWLLSFESLRARDPDAGARRVAMIGVANNGFHEGIQNKSALDMLANFCARSGVRWLGGAGIGSGEMMANVRSAPDDMFIKRPVSRALDQIAALAEAAIGAPAKGAEPDQGAPVADAGAASGDAAPREVAEAGPAPLRLYASHAFPRMVYIAAGHLGWRAQARANGVSRRAMLARPLEVR